MNLQIQQLAEQALEYAEKNQSADIPRHWFRLYNEKFAELIVKECVAIANRQFSAATGLDDRDCLTAQQMKQHFGVEK